MYPVWRAENETYKLKKKLCICLSDSYIVSAHEDELLHIPFAEWNSR